MKKARKFLAGLLALVMILCMLPATVVASSEQSHKDLAREVVDEGIVLLKNKNNALPLDTDASVALFGGGQLYTASTSNGYQIGGGGSGWMNMDYTPAGPADVLANIVDIYDPLTAAYRDNINYVPTDAMYEAAAEYADTAIMYITRYSSEGSDISARNWYLTDAETTMLKKLGNLFENVVVLINAPSMMATDWSLDGNEYGIDVDALLITYMGGEMGAYGMADILTGAVNPSGKLVDTYALDLYDYASTETFLESNSYTRYTDDIYVGYRYFETFGVDVAYEFGFGLSYTTFDIETESVTNDGENITVTAKVTNTGDVAGKEVVQVYYAPPMKGEGEAVLHKSIINLAVYAKTDVIAPGASETVELSYAIDDMASFDDNGASGHESCYVLEAGDYDILVGNSVKNNVVAGTYTVDELTVTEELSELCATNLDTRMLASVDEEGNVVRSEEDLNALGYKAEPVPVPAGEVVIVEAEDASQLGPNMVKEGYSSAQGWINNGTEWVRVNAGTVVGYLQVSANDNIDLTLNVEEAGKYNIGFVTANGSSNLRTCYDLLTYSVSADDGKTWRKYDTGIDFPNTNEAQSVTGYQWWNLVYTTADEAGNAYTVDLPAGIITLRFTVRSDAADGNANGNLDKFYLIPDGVTYTAADVYADMIAEEGTVIETIDLDEDHVGDYVIKLQDVADGTYTMEEFIAQMSYNELISLCTGHGGGVASGTGSIGFGSNATIEKYGAYSADTADGGAGLRITTYDATWLPCFTLQACTWNTELLNKLGAMVGDEAVLSQVDIWLAPGLNIHRSPLCGRNFEYFAEDPLVAGKCAVAVVSGIQSKGVGVDIKHFCANNKETNRSSVDSRLSEKALREIYMKAFEIAVKEANPTCIMTSYNYLNGIETAENPELLLGIVRGEWGWDGMFTTDWGNNSNFVREVNAGNNVKMPNGDVTLLRNAVQSGDLTRETLEDNATYIFKMLMKMTDFRVNQHRTVDVAATGTNTIYTTEYSNRGYATRFESVNGKFALGYMNTADDDDVRGFVEFTLNVEKAGEYEVTAYYATTAAQEDTLDIYVDGVKQNENAIASWNTGAWTSYTDLDCGTIILKEGTNVLKFQNKNTSGQNYMYFRLTAVDQANYITVDDANIKIGESAEINVTNYMEGLSSVTAVLNSEAEFTALTSDYDYLYNEETNEIIVWTDGEAGFASGTVLFTLNYEEPAAGEYAITLDIFDATGADSNWTSVKANAGTLVVSVQGDINGDGMITNVDVITLARYLVGLVELNEEQLERADFDGSGAITNADLVKLARYIVG